jgi:hypothetical protein
MRRHGAWQPTFAAAVSRAQPHLCNVSFDSIEEERFWPDCWRSRVALRNQVIRQ